MIKKILISQPKPSSERSPYFDIARDFDMEMVFRPFVKVEGISSREFRQQKISLSDFTAVVFTSRHAIVNFFKIAKELRVEIPDDMKYFCVTEQVALYIQKFVQYRKRKVFFGKTGKLDDVLPYMQKHNKEKFLVPLSDAHDDKVYNLLETIGIQHRECVMFRTVPNDFTPEEIEAFDFDACAMFSPSGVEAFHKNLGEKAKNVKIMTFGPATAKAARALGYEVELEAPTEKFPSMTSAQIGRAHV